MGISPSVFPLAAKGRLNMRIYQEWAEGTLDQKGLKQTDHISYVVDVHLSLYLLFSFFFVWVADMNLRKLSFVSNLIIRAVVF